MAKTFTLEFSRWFLNSGINSCRKWIWQIKFYYKGVILQRFFQMESLYSQMGSYYFKNCSYPNISAPTKSTNSSIKSRSFNRRASVTNDKCAPKPAVCYTVRDTSRFDHNLSRSATWSIGVQLPSVDVPSRHTNGRTGKHLTIPLLALQKIMPRCKKVFFCWG